MTTTTWTDLGPISDFPPQQHTCVTSPGSDGIPDTALVVLNVDGAFYVLKNQCPHAGAPLGDGERHGMTLTCLYHGYTYHIKTGKNIDFPDDERPVKTYPVRVEAGIVQVFLENEEA